MTPHPEERDYQKWTLALAEAKRNGGHIKEMRVEISGVTKELSDFKIEMLKAVNDIKIMFKDLPCDMHSLETKQISDRVEALEKKPTDISKKQYFLLGGCAFVGVIVGTGLVRLSDIWFAMKTGSQILS